MAGGGLYHDDGGVDDETDRDNEGHQGEIVETIFEQVHDPKRTDQRYRKGHCRAHCRPKLGQKEEYYHYHEGDGQQQRELHVCHTRPDRLGSVRGDGYLDGWWK